LHEIGVNVMDLAR